MSETKKINCAEAVTMLTGILCVEMGRVYELYSFVTGESLFTHQLPRAFRECKAHLEKEWPRLAECCRAAEPRMGKDTWESVLAELRAECGDSFDLKPFPEWTRVHPLEEEVLRGKSVVTVAVR